MNIIQDLKNYFKNYKSDPLVYINTNDSSLSGYIGILNNILDGVEDDLDFYIWNDTVGYNLIYCLDQSSIKQSQMIETDTVVKYIFNNKGIKVEIHFEI